MNVGVSLDPGNFILYIAWRILLVALRGRHDAKHKDQLDRYYEKPSEKVFQSVQDGLRVKLLEDGGDVLEAVGGIVHPWAKQADGMCQHLKIGRERGGGASAPWACCSPRKRV